MNVQLKNDAGVTRQVKVGFSWTAFFFGGIPFFFRGLPMHGGLYVGLVILLIAGAPKEHQLKALVQVANIVLGFLMNKLTVQYYLKNGYKPIGDGWDLAAKKWNLSLPS
jgi:hypothetical protein